MKRTCTRVLRSALSLVLVFCLALSLCGAAFATDAEETINYVSLGDSMSNGYCFTGYDQGEYMTAEKFLAGTDVYGDDAYPNLFASWLETETDKTVKHSKLAVSAMRAEDLNYLLGGREMPTDGWFDQVEYYSGTSGDNLKGIYQEAIADADVITMSIGNAAFGAYMVQYFTRMLGVMGGSLDEDEVVDLEKALAVLEPEEQAVIMDAYNQMMAMAAGYIPAELGPIADVDKLIDMMAYIGAGFILNYKGVLEQIVALNYDVEVVLIGLMNTTYGMEITGEGFDPIPIGDIVDIMFDSLNAYIAGLPAAMQAAGEWSEAKFYYTDMSQPEFIVQVFDDMAADGWIEDNVGLSETVVRSRTIKAYNKDLRGIIGSGFNMSLAEVNFEYLSDVEAFIMSGCSTEKYNENVAKSGILDSNGAPVINAICSYAIYLGIEDAVAESTDTLEIPLDGLIAIATDIKSAFIGFDAPHEDDYAGAEIVKLPADLRTSLANYLTNDDVLKGMCKIYGLFKIGDGMSVHPTPAAHANTADAVIAAYGKHTAKDETIKNIEVTLDALYNVLVTYGPEVAAEVWAQWEEYGYVESVEKTMGELEEMLTARYTYYTETALPAIEGAVGELAARKDVLCTELDALKAELEAKKAELEKVISEQEIGSVTLPDISIDIQLGNNEQTEVPENECLGVIEGASVEAELQAAIADLEHAIAVIEALITDIEADIADMVALAEQIAAAVAELEKTMEEIAAAAEDLAAAVEAAIAVLMDNEGVIDAVIKSFDAARATVLAANEVLELTLGVAEEITADIDTMIEKIAVDAEALYNKFLEELPGCIEQIPEEGMMLIGGAIAAAQYGLEEGKALIEARLQEELAALEAEYGMSEEEINAKLAELAAEYGISEESIRAELEAINAEIEAEVNAQYAAIEEQLKADIAALEAEAAAKIEALEAELAGYQAELEAAAEDAIEGIQAQIDRVTGDIAAVNEDLACAIEHLEAAAQTAYDQIVAEVTAAYEAAIAELEKALADLEAAYNEAVAALKDELAALKEAYDKAVDELTAAADKAIADLTAKVEEQLAELDKLGKDLAEIAGTIYDEIHDELEDAQTAIEEILKGNLDAIEDLKNALVELGAESVIDLVESIVAQIEAMFEEATTDDYVITPDSYYVAIGDGSAETESYVEELAAYLGIDCNNLAENGQEMEDAYGVIADNAENIAAADLITIGYSNSTFVGDAAEAALNGADLDWSTYVTDAGVAYVEDVLADISAELAANGITGELNDMAMAAIESYAYSSVAYACNLPGVVSAIRQINEDAVVIIVGQHNAFAGTTISAMGVEIDLGEYVDYLVDGAAVHGIAYCMITGDAIYVEAPNAATDTPAVIGIKELYGLLQDDSALYPNATGDLYIRDCILNALNITTQGLLGDADSNGVVNTTDAQLVLYYYTGKQTNVAINASVCDVDGNGAVNTSDAQLILYYYTGKITKFPVEN